MQCSSCTNKTPFLCVKAQSSVNVIREKLNSVIPMKCEAKYLHLSSVSEVQWEIVRSPILLDSIQGVVCIQIGCVLKHTKSASEAYVHLLAF